MRDPGVPVQDPQVENISFEHLTWTQKPNCKGLVAYLPVHRLDAFCRGWEETCNCRFIKRSSSHLNTRKNPPKKISSRTIFSQNTFWCQYGPEDNRGAAKVQKLEQGQRRSKVAAGESIKVGCRAYYTARVFYHEQSVVEINMLKAEHVDIDDNPLVHGSAEALSKLCQEEPLKGLHFAIVKNGGRRNYKAERRATAAILAARDIPDEDITFEDGEAYAFVKSSTSPDVRYRVATSQDEEAGGCSCLEGQGGKFCKHRAVVLLKLGLSDVDIRRRWGTLFGMNTSAGPGAAQEQGMRGSGPASTASTSVSQDSQHLSLQMPRQCGSALEDGKEQIMKVLQALERRPDLEHTMFYPLLADFFCKEAARLVSLHAKGLLIEGEAEHVIGGDDATGNSRARLKPYHERGPGEGNSGN